MEKIINSIGMENMFISMVAIIFVLLIIILTNAIKISQLNKKYKEFMQKLGNGKNIEEDLENYMYKVKKVEEQNGEILGNIQNIKKDLSKCTQKVGLYRYNAFKDVGSDLSFTLALLDEYDNGIVLNGIYSREMSNIYAKSVEAGKSKYTLSEEEKEAIQRAIESNQIHRI